METPHPSRTSSAPPSPTRGEGNRAHSCLLPALPRIVPFDRVKPCHQPLVPRLDPFARLFMGEDEELALGHRIEHTPSDVIRRNPGSMKRLGVLRVRPAERAAEPLGATLGRGV